MFAVKLTLLSSNATVYKKAVKRRRAELNVRFHQGVMDLSGEQRVAIGCALFDLMRFRIVASLPKNLTEEEKKRRLFERIYGAPMEDFLRGTVTDADFV
jgi:hypothetical protein